MLLSLGNIQQILDHHVGKIIYFLCLFVFSAIKSKKELSTTSESDKQSFKVTKLTV